MRKRTKIGIAIAILFGLMLLGMLVEPSPEVEKAKPFTKSHALDYCYEQAEKCGQKYYKPETSQGEMVENRLKLACLQVYPSLNISELLRFSTGLCQ